MSRRWAFLAMMAGGLLVADQVTKFLAVDQLTVAFPLARAHTLSQKVLVFLEEKDLLERGLARPPVTVVDNLWQLRYTQNRGAAWGVFSQAREGFRVPFFHLVTVGAVLFILGYYRKLDGAQGHLRVALALLLGGALGNGVDRVLRGYVIDFIDWHWFDPGWLNPGRHWPTFNVADSGVTIGLVILFLDMFLARKQAAGH